MIHTETVHASQLKRAMASYAAQGYPPRYGPHPDGDGMMVVVIVVPDDGAVPDWQVAPPPRRRRRGWRVDGRQVLAWLCVLVIVVGLGYLGYTMATGGTLPTWGEVTAQLPQLPWDAPPAQPHGEPVVEGTGWHWPWESSIVSQPKPRQDDGFRWPWQDAQESVNDGIKALTTGLTVVGVLFLLALVLWGIGLVRGAMGK